MMNNLSNEKAPSGGNASNPSPSTDDLQNASSPAQLIDKKGEKYLRESGNIEDMPDPEEVDEAEKIEKED